MFSTRRRWLIYLSVFAVGGLVYVNTLQNGFVLDDRSIVERNPLIRGVAGIPILLRADYWAPKRESGLYRPLTTTSYALNYEISGLDPAGYHAANVLLHATVSVLAAALFFAVAEHPIPAAAGALLFATHAIHTEAVANVVGRAELLATLFFVLALLAVVRSREAGGGRARWLAAGSLLAYLLALLSKESAVTLVGVVFFYDLAFGPGERLPLWPRLAQTLSRHWRSYGAYVLLTAAYLGGRYLAVPEAALPPLIQIDNPLVMLDPPLRILSALEVAFRYLALAFFPLQLSYDYSFDQIPVLTSLVEARALGVLVLCALAAAALVWAYRASASLFFAMGFYLATFSVVSNVVIQIGTIMGERLLYLPSVGFCLALPLVVWRLLGRAPLAGRTATALFVASFAVVVGLHAARTLDRNPYWESHERLYLHDVEVVPNSTKALGNAGAMLVGQERYEEALEPLQRAVEIAPYNEKASMMAGFAYTALERDEDAIRMYDLTVRYGTKDPAVYNNLGFLLADTGVDVARGVRLLEEAVRRAPRNVEFLDSLGWAYYKAGRLQEARERLLRSIELRPRGPTAAGRKAHLAQVEQALRQQGGAAGRSFSTKENPAHEHEEGPGHTH